ncbi:hypothetical protein [Methanosphaera sp. BMS]|uniref:hypothetical protein n=1 Tax=Methanosphaera sp. BMS TaxID=1789762 RepID=UPI0013A70212|nr:hypothetical protein [Methanosphaera sp. BMS]
MKIPENITLTLNNITLIKFYAENGGAIYSRGTLIINNSILNNNSAKKWRSNRKP